jgi:hypothetical protein
MIYISDEIPDCRSLRNGLQGPVHIMYRGEQPNEDSSIDQPSLVPSSHVKNADKRALVWVEMRDPSNISLIHFLLATACDLFLVHYDRPHTFPR